MRRNLLVLFVALMTATLAVIPAAAQISQNVIYRSNLDEYVTYSDVWGYTAPDGEEYALLGTAGGTSVINVTDPGNPYETGFLSGPASTWRDIKTYQSYAYVTNESSGGLEIIDLTDPENPVALPGYTGFTTAHNLFIDQATGRCYIAGSNLAAGGVRVLSLANPTAPVEVGSWEGAYLHDVMVQNDVLFGSAIFGGTLYILAAADPANIVPASTISGYPGAFTHNAWVTPDGLYVMTTDEVAGAACRMWDLATLTETDLYLPNPTTIPHNAQIDGDLAVISHYTIGVRIVDVSDPHNMQELGYYDTWPIDDNGTFNGCWGAFPFFQTNPDLIAVSDITSGLHLLEYKGALGGLAGTVTEAGTGTPVAGSAIEIVETGVTTTADGAGVYGIEDVGGAVTVRASAFGYADAFVPAVITVGDTATANLQMMPLPSAPFAGRVTDAQSGLGVPDATVQLLGTPVSQTTDSAGDYDLVTVPAGNYVARVKAFGYNVLDVPVTVVASVPFVLDVPLNLAAVALDFETTTGNWFVNGTASTGAWEHGDPVGTASGTVQPEDDHTPASGVNAWITGLAGGSSTSNDVDGGATVLTSTVYFLSGMSDPHVSYWRWYQTGVAGNASRDFFVAEVSPDGGTTWVVLDATDRGAAQWVEVDLRLSSFINVGNITRFRFTAQDTGAASVTEAGIDDFMIYDQETSVSTGAPEGVRAPRSFTLGTGRPNPFRTGGVTRLVFEIPERQLVAADVYDVAGRHVAGLLRDVFPAGSHHVQWDGRLAAGGPAPAGVYFLCVEAAGRQQSRKMLLLR